MKKIIFHILLLATVFISANLQTQAQTPYWSEDFANGLNGPNGAWLLEGPNSIWKHSLYGTSGEWSAGTPQPQFTSVANGFMLFDADSANWPVSPNYVALQGSLVSPQIDLSSEPSCILEFENYARSMKHHDTLMVVEVSADDGINWTMIDLSDMLPATANPETVSLNITSYVLGSSTVRIKFTFGLNPTTHYFWGIDDVRLVHSAVNDLVLMETRYDTSNSLAGAIVEYSKCPDFLQQDLHPGGNYYNNGSDTQTNSMLEFEVQDNLGGVVSFMSSITLPAAPWSTTSMDAGAYFPTMIGEYNFVYTVVQDQTDEVPADNTKTISYEVTEHVYARDRQIAGALWNSSDGNGSANPYELGNLFEFEEGALLNSIDAYIGASSEAGALVYGILYDYDPVAGTFTYLDQTTDHSILASELDSWISLSFNSPPMLAQGHAYLAAVGYYGGADFVYIGSAEVAVPFTTFILDGTDNTWYYTGLMPAVRMFVTRLDDSVEEQEFADVSLFPNPNNGTFELSNLPAGTAVKVYNTMGQEVWATTHNGGQNGLYQIDGLASGIYHVQLQSEGAARTIKMLVH